MATQEREGSRTRSLLAAVALSIGGLVGAELMTAPAFLADPTIAESPADAARASVIALFVLNFTGFFVVGGLYLWWTDRGLSYLDLRVPGARGWLYVVGGVLGSIAFIVAVQTVALVLDLPASENQVLEFVGDDPNTVLLLIVVVFALNAPAEEFLFRNVVQKRLYAAFSRAGAVVAASAIFALVHIPAYALAPDGTFAEPGAIAVSLAVVFGGALIFGGLYARTDNLVVPIAAHAAFNAFQFGVLYLALRYDPEQLEAALSLVPV